MIELAGNLIIRDGKILLLYREDEGHWEVPGGKVEEEESPIDAAVREAREEIGVEVELKKPFYSGEFQKDGQMFLWHGYIADTDGEPEIQEEKFGELEWVDPLELDDMEIAPNLEMVLPALRRIK
ncbi:NUDIX hydrolase [Candidatus Nanohalovita haloferacivicina]|uniref:NUDIX hydrolase n=1 Tax=Candidatus Nanohalovita haloferacivicina TaxID=2978046 RepID=UPI00325F962F|nr:8-oxo-dGTP diphosphatase [Candidatus Nanohalobia archaeon BNXNv]